MLLPYGCGGATFTSQTTTMKNFSTLFALLVLSIALIAQPPTNFKSAGIGGGGALFSPSINPSNHNDIYMGCDMSELFHSTDGGATWGQLNFAKVQGGHDSQVQFTNDPNILYTVDYTSQGANDYIRPMKSIDAGQNWQVMAGSPYPLAPNGNVLRLLADPHNANHVVIADYGTINFSSNGGTTFTQIHTCISNGAGNHIAGVYWDGNNIYIGTNDGVIFSTNGGTSFTTMTTTGITTGESILSFAGGKSGGTTRFYCLTSTSVWSGYQYGSNYYNAMAGVYVMDNANATWTKKVNGISIGTDFPVFVGMAENNIDTAYISGGSSSGSPIVMKTTNGGNAWGHALITANNQNVTTGWAGTNGDHAWSFPEAPFGFTVALNDVNVVMFTDYSESIITRDGGSNWHQQYVSVADENPAGASTPKGKKYHGIGMENTTNWNVMWTDSTHMFSSFSDIGGVMSDDKGQSWKFIPIAYNSIYHVVKGLNNNIYAATSSVHDMYETTRLTNSVLDAGNGKVYFSTDNGATFNILHDFTKPVIWLAWDSTRPNRMYAAVINSTIGGIYVTNNLNLGAASTWTKLTNPPRTLGHPLNIRVLNDGTLVASYSATKSNTGSTFSQSSGVFYSTDSGTTWLDRSDAKMQYYTKDVVIDPTDPTQNTWYACVAHAWGNAPSTANGLLRTTDRGQHWTQISNAYRVNSCTVNPANHDEMYFTTDVDGLWYTGNLTNASPTFTLVDAYPFRSPVRVAYNPYKPTEMWVSSFGNGMRYSAAPDTIAQVNPTTTFTITQPDCQHSKGSIHITSTAVTWDLYKLASSQGQTIDSVVNKSGSFNIDSLAAGNYTIYLTLGTYYDTLLANIIASTPVTAGFTVDSTSIQAGGQIVFTNTSNGNAQYAWFFGNGITDTAASPSPQVYDSAGNYIVTLVAYNANCGDTVSQAITVRSITIGIADIEQSNLDITSAGNVISIWNNTLSSTTISIEIYDLLGKRVYENNTLIASARTNIQLLNINEGVYFVKVNNSGQITTRKLFITGQNR